MENFWESVNLMIFVYVLAAAVSLGVAWIIKLLFSIINLKEKRAAANAELEAASADSEDKAAEGTA